MSKPNDTGNAKWNEAVDKANKLIRPAVPEWKSEPAMKFYFSPENVARRLNEDADGETIFNNQGATAVPPEGYVNKNAYWSQLPKEPEQDETVVIKKKLTPHGADVIRKNAENAVKAWEKPTVDIQEENAAAISRELKEGFKMMGAFERQSAFDQEGRELLRHVHVDGSVTYGPELYEPTSKFAEPAKNLADILKADDDIDLEVDVEHLAIKNDNVNHPAHYLGFSNGAEVIDIAENLNYNRGNIVKYASRAGRKTDAGLSDLDKEIEDIKKVGWYAKRELERLEKLKGSK